MQSQIRSSVLSALRTILLTSLFLAGAAFSGTLGGCGGGGDGGAKDSGPGCQSSCDTLGKTRCLGSSIEGCAIDSSGCLQWVTGVDCSASATRCDDSSGSASCAATPDNCKNGTKDSPETDTDCGGPTCPACAVGLGCMLDSDCQSGSCDPTLSVCAAAPSCSDGLQNQDETDTDCGGSTCAACAVGLACVADTDCQSALCDPTQKLCRAPGSCSDGLKNQDETDTDCGGSTCAACAVGGGCLINADCQSSSCDLGNTNACVTPSTPTCLDGVQNQDETDVDCGGGCPACALGAACQSHSGCQSGVCDLQLTHTCINTDPMYQVNEDYERGDFSRFPYTMTSDQTHDWLIETDPSNCHAGSFCARTNPAHASTEISSYSTSLSVRQNTNITFWAKVNSELNEHFFRFYIDGVEQVAVSGQVDWTLYSFPVAATGPNGSDRIFSWEFARSAYMDPNHPPQIEAWVDDIDMPDWNTQPTPPEVVRPWNGTLTIDPSPVFEWQSFDPDFDTITYELQWDTDPAFSLPFSTGETGDSQYMPATPLTDGAIYYWRVRAKDNSDYRWSTWGGPWAVQIDTRYEYSAVWRQSVDAEFNMDTVNGVVVAGDRVSNNAQPVNINQNMTTTPQTGASSTLSFSALPPASSGTPATFLVAAAGDLNSSSTEFFDIYADGTLLGRLSNTSCYATATFTLPDIAPLVADGVITLRVTAGSGVNHGGCIATSAEHVDVTLSYQGGVTAGTLVSTPIDFSLFAGRKTWEKIQIEGTGPISLRVLDATGTAIPDALLPGNSAGISARTLHLWKVEPRDFPTIVLEATLGVGASLDAWQVVGSDIYSFTFSHPGDDEGWVGQDFGVTPTVSTAGGVLRLDSLAAGTDPHLEYFFDQPLDASRFSTVELRLRTGNNYNNDNVSFYWQSNFGLFDTRRSLTHPDVFLQSLQDLSFDLTAAPIAPGEAWQGQIEGIRIDPVDRFYDNLVQPADGWFEIERIAIY